MLSGLISLQLDPLIWETESPRTHKPKIVNESLLGQGHKNLIKSSSCPIVISMQIWMTTQPSSSHDSVILMIHIKNKISPSPLVGPGTQKYWQMKGYELGSKMKVIEKGPSSKLKSIF